jgi:hypothetical protein
MKFDASQGIRVAAGAKEVLVEDLPKKLVTQLAANRGAADVVGAGDDIIGKFKPSRGRTTPEPSRTAST